MSVEVRLAVPADAEAMLRAHHVAGFGMVVPSDEELRAVYVHPDYGRRGIGTAILKELEAQAVARGVAHLDLVSSLNAEEFYSRHGYEVLARTVHRLRSGHEMACVRMVKNLQPLRL